MIIIFFINYIDEKDIVNDEVNGVQTKGQKDKNYVADYSQSE